ncbi:MAG: RDD family protein [Solirubrobacteraceae bacterium]|nr:RDD family protein [Solirubrobacteraceae bacterium]
MADATSTPATLVDPAAAPARPVYLLASFGQRVRAHVIDTLIVLVPTFGLWALLLPPLVQLVGDDQRLQDDIDAWDVETGEGPIGRILFWMLVFSWVIWGAFVVVRGVYEAVFQARTAGQTPGRRAVGIRVMRADGRPVRFWWALYRALLVREVLFGFASLITGGLAWLVQYLWPLWDQQRRTLHDVVARSRVVQDAEEA